MKEWISVREALPKRNEQVYATDDAGRIFTAAYFGPSVGWVDLKRRMPANVTHWARAM